MSINNLFDHSCNIYHQIIQEKELEYGLKSSNVYTYENEVSEKYIPCHFKNINDQRITQKEAFYASYDDIKVILPFGTNVVLNDKIVNAQTNEQYIAGFPINYRNSHIIVRLRKIESLGYL